MFEPILGQFKADPGKISVEFVRGTVRTPSE